MSNSVTTYMRIPDIHYTLDFVVQYQSFPSPSISRSANIGNCKQQFSWIPACPLKSEVSPASHETFHLTVPAEIHNKSLLQFLLSATKYH